MSRRVPPAALALLVSLGIQVSAQTYQSHIEHPIVHYQISAKYDAATKKVAGHYHLTWWNHTEDSIPDLYFHLYLNAFKNLDSTFLRESSITPRRNGLREWIAGREEQDWGWVDVDRLQIAGGADLTRAITYVHPDDDNALDQTVIRVPLPQPIPPHGSIELEVDFTSKLPPRNRRRTGYDDDYILVAQWFPKIGVYEGAGERGRKTGGWNCHQYHAKTEFYADYGTWDVDLTVPSNYVVGATGFLRRTQNNADRTTSYYFHQDDVHDFAWTAGPHFIKLTRTFDWSHEVRGDELMNWARILNLPADQVALRDVSVTLLLQPDHRNLADAYFRAAFNGLKYFGLWYGQYPYDTLTVVDPRRGSNTGGMEYPTFIVAGTYFWPGEGSFDPEDVTVHEFGHQFWYGLVGNNEFEEAWLDEGLDTYSTGKVLENAYGQDCNYEYVFGMPVPAYPWFDLELPQFPFAGIRIPMGSYFECVGTPERTNLRLGYLEHAKDDDLVRNGWQYLDGDSYVVNSYGRPSLVLRTLESYLGPETMARVMRTFQQRWRYRHPATRDFINVVNEVSGQDMDWFFEQFFYSSNVADYEVSELSSEPLEAKVGVYDENGKRHTYFERDAAQAAEKNTGKLFRSTVVVRRLGEALAPVDVVIRLDNGETIQKSWDGKYRWVKFVFEKPSRLVSAEVDPERKLALEANFTNNSRLAEPDNRAAAKWYIRWIFWLENLYFAAGFFN